MEACTGGKAHLFLAASPRRLMWHTGGAHPSEPHLRRRDGKLRKRFLHSPAVSDGEGKKKILAKARHGLGTAPRKRGALRGGV